MKPMIRTPLIAIAWGMIAGISAPALGATEVRGLMTCDGLTGKSATPHGWDDQWAYVGQLDVGEGAGGGTWYDPHGWYRVPQVTPPYDFPGGTYALFAIRYEGPFGFAYRTDVVLPSQPIIVDNQNLNTPAHYSVMYNASWYEWAAEPWVWGTDFYQTFVATQEHVTRVCTKLAGKEGDHQVLTLNFAVYQPNAGPPSTWTQILPTRSLWIGGNVDPIIHIFWATYRSNEATLTPGQTYAARFWRAPGSPSQNFAIVARPDSSGNGYTGGMMYNGDTALPGWDAYAHISGGQPGTLVNHAPAYDIQAGDTGTWATTHGQTFQATGRSIAAIDVNYITGDPAPPTKKVTFRVYDSVGGSPIGPPKVCWGLPGHYQARAAAFWEENDVPVVPGNMYYVEWTIGDSGASVYYMRDNVPGDAYTNRVSQAPYDMLMAIAEYLPSSPIIELSVSSLHRRVQQGKNLPPDPFTISNGGGDTLNYNITDNMSWLSVLPGSGSCTTEQDTVNVNYGTSSLAVGTYTGTITVTANALNSPQTIDVSLEVYIPGDFDADVDVDMEDFGHFQACLTGPGINVTDPDCLDANLDGDNDVDGDDFTIFHACLSGAGIPPAPACAP